MGNTAALTPSHPHPNCLVSECHNIDIIENVGNFYIIQLYSERLSASVSLPRIWGAEGRVGKSSEGGGCREGGGVSHKATRTPQRHNIYTFIYIKLNTDSTDTTHSIKFTMIT